MEIKVKVKTTLKQKVINRARVNDLATTTRFAFKLLSSKDKVNLASMVLFQIAFGLIDLVGVFLLGVISSNFWSTHGSGGLGISTTLTRFLDFFHLQNRSVIQLSIFTCVLFVLKALFSTLNARRLYSHLARFTNDISINFVQLYLGTPYVFLRKLNEQRFYFAFTDGLNSLIIGVLGSLILLISDGFLLLFLFTALCLVNFSATLIMLLFFCALAVSLLKWIAPKVRAIGNSLGSLSNLSRESLLDVREMYPTIRSQDQMGFLTSKITRIRAESSSAFARGEWLISVPKNVLEISAILGVFLIIIYASTATGKGISVALVSLFFAASSRIVPALIRIQGNWLAYSRSVGYSIEGMEMYRLVRGHGSLVPRKDSEQLLTRQLNSTNTAVSLKDVCFRYPDGVKDSISHVTFDIQKGEKVAIVGDSGAGKTTLANLILGLYQPTSGEFIESFSNETHSTVRYGYLPQVPHIISGTLLENIVLTDRKEDIDFDRLERSLQDARIAEFVEKLPQKIETPLGPRGVSLSGGQKQRIALARVLYSNQDVIVLDEPTSSLDAETDDIVSEMLVNKLEQKTVIIVAHRYSTIRKVDRILYLHHGEVVCFDTWDVVRSTVPKFELQANLQGFVS